MVDNYLSFVVAVENLVSPAMVVAPEAPLETRPNRGVENVFVRPELYRVYSEASFHWLVCLASSTQSLASGGHVW